MKYNIDGATEIPVDPVVKITLERDSSGEVHVLANEWYIITFKNDGTLVRCAAVPSNLGFKVDTEGHVLCKREQ